MDAAATIALLALVLAVGSLGWQAVTAYRHRRRLIVTIRPIYAEAGVGGHPAARTLVEVGARALWGPQGIESVYFAWEPSASAPGFSHGSVPDLPGPDGRPRPPFAPCTLQDGESATWGFRIATSGSDLPEDAYVRAVVTTTAGKVIRTGVLRVEADRLPTAD